jgi:cell division septal protein FtsQ
LKSETSSKMLGLLLFVILCLWILYMSVTSQKTGLDQHIKKITVTGNTLLQENEYLTYARLNTGELLDDITLPVIKSRLEKHPYIYRADVEFSGDNEVHINLHEKYIKAVVASENVLFLATEDFEILPFIPNTNIPDKPVVTNLDNSDLLKTNEILKTSGLVDAFKIMDAANLTNEELAKKLSEINLRKGGDVILLISGMKPPVILGRGNIARKIYSFNQLLKADKSSEEIVMNSSYIDLRFKNEIFLGNIGNTGLAE